MVRTASATFKFAQIKPLNHGAVIGETDRHGDIYQIKSLNKQYRHITRDLVDRHLKSGLAQSGCTSSAKSTDEVYTFSELQHE